MKKNNKTSPKGILKSNNVNIQLYTLLGVLVWLLVGAIFFVNCAKFAIKIFFCPAIICFCVFEFFIIKDCICSGKIIHAMGRGSFDVYKKTSPKEFWVFICIYIITSSSFFISAIVVLLI